ncbi:hypothetical protein HMPREF1980_00191, partial [Actinomyces sp. oral taxon 172 str. F0311]
RCARGPRARRAPGVNGRVGRRGRGVAVCGCAMHEYSVVPGPVVITKLTSGHAICADRHVQTFVTPGWFVGIVIRG